MKNKKILLTIAGISLLLGACGSNSKSSSNSDFSLSSASNDVSSSSIKTSFESTLEKLKYFLDETNNCTLEDTAGEIKSMYFSENAFFYDFCELYEKDYDYVDCGYLKSPQGIFKYYLDGNNKVLLDHCESVGKQATIKDLMDYPSDLFADLSLWVKDSETSYHTTDKDLKKVVGFLGGYSDYSSYITSITITFEEALKIENALLSFELNSTTVSLKFYDIGNTKGQWIDEFNANPTLLEDPEDFPELMKQDMKKVLHQDLPFYKATYSISYDQELQTLFDYGCGNIVDSYGRELLKQGYYLDAANSKNIADTDGNPGFVDSVYYKNIYQGDEVIAIDYVEVGFTSGCYFDDYYWTDGDYERIYPEGRTTITFISKDLYNDAKYNSFISQLANEYKGFGENGSFTFSEKNYFTFSNFNEYASYLGCECYYTFSSTYTNENTLLVDVNNYIDSLTKADYVLYDGTVEEKVITFYKNNEEFAMNFTISFNDKNELEIAVFVTDAVVQPEGFTLEQVNDKLSFLKRTYSEVILIPNTIVEVENINVMDLTDMYKDTYEGKAYEAVYFGSAYIFNYETASDAKKTAKALSQALTDAKYTKSDVFTFEEDDCESFTYESENYTIETTILLDENTVTFIMMIVKPF